MVGALVARKLGVGYVDQVVLEDSAARDVLKAPVLAADESFRVVGAIHSALGMVARRDA